MITFGVAEANCSSTGSTDDELGVLVCKIKC